jgi:bacteriorhodopsin
LRFDLIVWLTGAGVFGAQNAFGTLVYVLVGLAALYQAAALRSIQRRWGGSDRLKMLEPARRPCIPAPAAGIQPEVALARRPTEYQGPMGSPWPCEEEIQ